jgi:hypothetical protein
MKFNLRFFLTWILASVTMFSLFYVWHGVFLNDFKRLNFPYIWFVLFAAVTYLILSFALIFLFESQMMRKIDNFMTRGVFCGILLGFSLFMIMTVLHISFTQTLSARYLLFDCGWQIAEQTCGGMVVAACRIFLPSMEHERA